MLVIAQALTSVQLVEQILKSQPSLPLHIEAMLCQRISDRWLMAECIRWSHSSCLWAQLVRDDVVKTSSRQRKPNNCITTLVQTY